VNKKCEQILTEQENEEQMTVW